MTQEADRERTSESRGGPPGRLSRLSHDIYLEIAGVTLVAPAVFLLSIQDMGGTLFEITQSVK